MLRLVTPPLAKTVAPVVPAAAVVLVAVVPVDAVLAVVALAVAVPVDVVLAVAVPVDVALAVVVPAVTVAVATMVLLKMKVRIFSKRSSSLTAVRRWLRVVVASVSPLSLSSVTARGRSE